jgi:hypothetical protein
MFDVAMGFARQCFGRSRSVTKFRGDIGNGSCRRLANCFELFNPKYLSFDLAPHCLAKLSRYLAAAMILIKQCQDIPCAVRRGLAKSQQLLFKRAGTGCAAREILQFL